MTGRRRPPLLRPLLLLLPLLHSTGGSDSGCPDNRCCRNDVADYIRLCRAVRQYCIPQQQPNGVCECDVDGNVLAHDRHNVSGPKVLVRTGRPGCARHTSTWHTRGGEYCYVPYECTEGKTSWDHATINWRPCTSHNPRCPAGCQAALDDILAAGTVKDCITDQASRQVCPGYGRQRAGAGNRWVGAGYYCVSQGSARCHTVHYQYHQTDMLV